ncbi:MAG: type 4a pilus biogenesis protein PilO [Patescibacteria group bacterium]|nr:type 4a pilus biogenesis protein PilO [Patescibacteria group bacterium]
MSKEFKRKITTQAALAGIIVIAAAAVLIYLGKNIQAVSAKIYGLRTQASVYAADIVQISNLREQAKLAVPYSAKLASALPSKSNVIVLSNTVDTVALKDGVNVGFRFGAEGQRNAVGLNYVGFEMSVQGSYNNIVQFISDLEGGGNYLVIDNISLLAGSNGMDGVINGRVYFYDNGTGQGQ